MVGVGVVGMGVMGSVHSRGMVHAPTHFPESEVRPVLVVCADESEARAKAGASQFGFDRYTRGWQDVIEAEDVNVVLICTPNHLHREVTLAAVENGKHVFCEKPVGRTPRETLDIRDSAGASGVTSAAGYVYRWAPLVRYARELIATGRLGEITHYRGRFLAGYAKDPLAVWSWRFDPSLAGSGALGGLMSHVIDLAQFLNGAVDEVVADMQTFIKKRPFAVADTMSNEVSRENGGFGEVGNEDYVSVLTRFANGARGVLQACRVISGPACEFSFDISGTKGAISWNLERMNELHVHLPGEGLGGYTRVLSGPEHPGHSCFSADPGMGLGFEDLVILQAQALLERVSGVRSGKDRVLASFDDAAAVAEVEDAVERSWLSCEWEGVGEEQVRA